MTAEQFRSGLRKIDAERANISKNGIGAAVALLNAIYQASQLSEEEAKKVEELVKGLTDEAV